MFSDSRVLSTAYKRPQTTKGGHEWWKYVYDEHFDCFFSSQGIARDGMISDQSERETALRKLMIKNSKKQYFLFDGSKYGKHLAFRLTPVQDVTGYITDISVDFHTSNE